MENGPTPDTMSSDAIHCSVIRHVQIEDLGYLGERLERGGVRFSYLDARDISAASLGDRPEGLIVLGGPMGAYETDGYPYLPLEIELIRRRLQENLPVLGICLGAQLLAAAAGAPVYPGQRGKEIGWGPVTLTPAGRNDPLWTGFPDAFSSFHWHGDTFEAPPGSTVLARSPHYIQAFRLGNLAYGIQFHPEVVPLQLESWITAYRLELQRQRLSSDDVLNVPDAEGHRQLACRFGDNVVRWLTTRGRATHRNR